MTNFVMLVGPHRYRLTQQALESLAAHTDLTSLTCTFVLDTADDWRTEQLIESFADTHANCTALMVRHSGHTLSQLKNLGVAWSEQRFGRGDWLYLSDSDVYFMPDWLKILTDAAAQSQDQNYDLWGGQCHPFHHEPLQVLDGPSWLITWRCWDDCGPFDRTTAPGVCRSEEYPFCQRLLAGGGKIGVIHPHVVIHTGLTHLNGADAPGHKERELLIPKGVVAL